MDRALPLIDADVSARVIFGTRVMAAPLVRILYTVSRHFSARHARCMVVAVGQILADPMTGERTQHGACEGRHDAPVTLAELAAGDATEDAADDRGGDRPVLMPG
jgi:hypothetical protein